ncbi:MAG TPA: CoA ester lyase [Microbacterium sp.]|nr:CoA ester lyase [Microbacterium sp.]
MLRSLLNVPGNRPDMLEKASGYGADALIIDLEDAVPAAQKVETRVIAREFVDTFARRGNTVLVRVNGPDTGLMEDDLTAVVRVALTGVQVPKVHSADDVLGADTVLTRLEEEARIPTGHIELLISLESAAAIHFAYDILSAAPRVGCALVAAAEHGDLHGDLRFVTTKTEEEILYVRSAALVAARAAGVPYPIDGVYADVRDIDGFADSCRRARQIGYRGKKVIHPRQVDIANEIFSATPQELEHYERILEAMGLAEREGRAVAEVDGRMVDIAMVETARRALEEIRR